MTTKTTGVMAEPTLILLMAGRAPQFSRNSQLSNPGVCGGPHPRVAVQLCPCLPALHLLTTSLTRCVSYG